MREKRPENIFNTFHEIDPPVHLRADVFERIKMEQQKIVFRKKVLLQCGFFVSTTSLFTAVAIFGKSIAGSDFWSISLLGLTDMKIVAIYWQEFVFSLLETFPFAEFICVLTPVFILLVLAKQYSSSYEYTNSREQVKC
jgi:hypothetical protein